jgi:hypothetical protein
MNHQRRRSLADPEPQVIAEAIAAFHMINDGRNALGIEPLNIKYIAAITMKGVAPIFYRIPVTIALVQAISLLAYPVAQTIAFKYTPPVLLPNEYRVEGMYPLANRRLIF